MILLSVRFIGVVILLIIKGSTTHGVNGKSGILDRWKIRSDVKDPLNIRERTDVLYVRNGKASYSKRKGIFRRKSKMQIHQQRQITDKVNEIQPILNLNRPYHALVFLNDGAHSSSQHLATTQLSLAVSQSQQKVGGNREQTVSPKPNHIDKRDPTISTNVRFPTPQPSTDPKQTSGVAPTIHAQVATSERKYMALPADYTITHFHSKQAVNGDRSSLFTSTIGTLSQTSKPLSHHWLSQVAGSRHSTETGGTSTFSVRSLFSFRRNLTLKAPNIPLHKVDKKKQVIPLHKVDKKKQVIMLTDMFNKSLSKTWKLLIPHPKLVKPFKNQTNDVLNPVTDEKATWISSLSFQQSPEKLKRKKAKAYTLSDHRPSAIGIGSVGALVLVSIIVGIIILDSRSLYRDAKRLRRGIYNLCRPVYKPRLTVSTTDNKGLKWAYVIHERHV